jgi:hypothetical protein
MNNQDRYQLALRRDPLEAAALALNFSAGCGSKLAAWNWADRAVEAAAKAGVTLDPGNLSWPELDQMDAQLKAVRP